MSHCPGCVGSIVDVIHQVLPSGYTVGQDWKPCPGCGHDDSAITAWKKWATFPCPSCVAKNLEIANLEGQVSTLRVELEQATAEVARLNAILDVYRRLGFYAPGESADTVLDHMQRIAKSNLELLDKKEAEVAALRAVADAATRAVVMRIRGQLFGDRLDELQNALAAWEKTRQV